MTGWIIFGSILLVLVLIFIQSVTVIAVYDKNPDLPMVEVKFMFFTILKYPSPPKKAKKRKPAKASKKAAKADSENGEDSRDSEDNDTGDEREDTERNIKKSKQKPEKEKKKLSFDLEMIMDYVRSASPPIKRLFKKIRVRDLYIDFVVGSDDAAKTALKYGGLCAAVYPLIKFLTTYFDVKPKEVNIEADFSSEKDDFFAYGVVKLRVCTALGCALWLLFRVVKTYLKYNKCSMGTKAPKKQKA